MKDDLEMPGFLKRTETEAQAEARRKKNQPKNDSKGLKVVTPPDPKISAAIAKDFAETKKKEKLDAVKADVERLKNGKSDPFKNVKAFVEKGQAAQKAVDAAIASAATKKKNDAWKAVTTKPPKKAGGIVAKALKARDELHAKAKTAISATNGKKPVKKPAKSGRYDWAAAEEAAKAGKVPATPDFSAPTHKCYRPRLAEIEKLVKAKNLKALKAMKDSDFRNDGSPLIMNRYRKLAIKALEA